MNLSRIRVQLALAFGAMLAVVVVIFAVVVDRVGAAMIRQDAERDVEHVMRELLLEPDLFGIRDQLHNVWYVNPEEGNAELLGGADVEPPAVTIAREASEGEPYLERFEQDGTWLAYAVATSPTDRYLTILDYDGYQGDQRLLRVLVTFGALVAVAGTTAAGWWFAGRSLAPARQAMAQQRDFIADAAHELRTPLAVIQASASQALSRPREAWEYERSLHEIQVAAERAGNGVGTLLDLARLEAGQAVPRLAPLRLDLLVEEVGAAIRVDGVAIVAQPGEPLIVNADYAMLRQAVGNLVENAAARSASVRLSTTREEPHAVIEVVDDGPGFDPDTLPQVFTRFRRGDQRGAAGLGMAIVKTIVDVHRGTCEATNRPAPDHGAVVRIRLPIAGE